MPRSISLIRHAEKQLGDGPPHGVLLDGSPDPESLTPRGWQRAGALVGLFIPRADGSGAAILPTRTDPFASEVGPHTRTSGRHVSHRGSRSGIRSREIRSPKSLAAWSHLVLVLVVALLAVACGGAPGGSVSSSQPSQAPVPAPSALPTSATSASTSSAAVSSSGPSWTYVAFGDSWPYGAHCNGCRPFPVLYAEGLAAATGRHVDFVNLATNGGTAQGLLADFKSSKPIRDDLARADIVMIAIGGNDYGPAFDASAAGTCGGADKLDCFRTVAKTLRMSFDGMLTEIEQLRQGRPTAIRLIATSNEFLADPDLIAALGADFGKTRGVAVTKMNREVACEVAAAHDAKCVDLGLALNGPELLKPQDVNTQDAMQAAADAIVASGVDELR